MADFINFEADIDGDNKETDEDDDEVSNMSDVDSENSLLIIRKSKQILAFVDILLMLRMILNKF